VIDRTLTENNIRWIIDYKLGLEVSEDSAEAAAQNHKTQLAGYAKLFAHDGLPVKTAVFFLNLGRLIAL
jgi:ATP-dependent helicase/nuclease subunit A